jgi:uncharacterized protein (DUF736 family)
MSKQYDNTNRGVLFKNEQKKTDKHPDYSGNLNVDGVEFFLDAWIKEAESGRKFMSLSVKLKERQGQSAPKTHGQMREEKRRADDGDVPF